MRFFRNLGLFLAATCVSYLFVILHWLLLPAFPFYMYAEFCKTEKEDGTPLPSARIFFLLLSWITIILYAITIVGEIYYYPKYGNVFGIAVTVVNLLTVIGTVVTLSKHFSPSRPSPSPGPDISSEPPPAITSAPEPTSAPAPTNNDRFYSERFDFICNSVSAYIQSEQEDEASNKAFTPETAAEVIFPLLVFAAVTVLNDHDFEEYCFKTLYEASVSLNKACLYTNAVKHYNSFVDLYNSCPHGAKEAFESWQYKASKNIAEKIYGSADPISSFRIFIFLMDFTKFYIKLQQEQEAGVYITVSPPSPPPSPDSLRDPSTLIKTPDTYVPLFCRKCGSVIPLDSVYCPECGEKVVVIR